MSEVNLVNINIKRLEIYSLVYWLLNLRNNILIFGKTDGNFYTFEELKVIFYQLLDVIDKIITDKDEIFNPLNKPYIEEIRYLLGCKFYIVEEKHLVDPYEMTRQLFSKNEIQYIKNINYDKSLEAIQILVQDSKTLMIYDTDFRVYLSRILS